jgi:hypothetical protein
MAGAGCPTIPHALRSDIVQVMLRFSSVRARWVAQIVEHGLTEQGLRSSSPKGGSGGFAGFNCPPAGRGGQADHTAIPGHSPGGSSGRVGLGARHIGRSHSLDHAGGVGHAPNIGALAEEGPAQPSVVGERRARAGGAVRRSETFVIPIASCLQGTILAPIPARPPRPAAWLTAIRHFGRVPRPP